MSVPTIRKVCARYLPFYSYLFLEISYKFYYMFDSPINMVSFKCRYYMQFFRFPVFYFAMSFLFLDESFAVHAPVLLE